MSAELYEQMTEAEELDAAIRQNLEALPRKRRSESSVCTIAKPEAGVFIISTSARHMKERS